VKLLRPAAIAVVYTMIVLFIAGPFLWLISASLQPVSDVFAYPPGIVPPHPSLRSYWSVIADSNVRRYLANSILLASISTAGALSLACLAAYGFARFQFRAKSTALIALLAMNMIPSVGSVVALYKMVADVGLQNRLIVVAFIRAGGVAAVIWLLKGYFESIPPELEETALTDGCSRFGAFLKVALPLARPGLVVSSVILFAQNYNAFFLPFVLIHDKAQMPASVGVFQFASEHGIQIDKVSAFSVIYILPVLLAYWLVQRSIWRLKFGFAGPGRQK